MRDRINRGRWSGKLRRAGPFLAALIALELVIAGISLHSGPSAPQHAAPPPTSASPSTSGPTDTSARPAPRPPATINGTTTLDRVRQLLERRAHAITTHDRAGFLATVDPTQPKLRAAQNAFFTDVSAVPFATWRYDVGSDPGLPAVGRTFTRYHAPVYAAAIQLVYALQSVDPVPTTRNQFLTFVNRNGTWYFGSDSDFASVGKPSWQGIWDFGPIVVHRGARCLVLSHPDHAAELPAIADQVDQAIDRVSAVWGTAWPRRVAVLLPDTQEEMTGVVGGGLDLAHIAAVATADYTNTRTGVARGQRVVINPVHLMALGSIGRPVVLRHELTHVATRTVTGPSTPVWLAEGFADFVGYYDTGISVRLAAQELQIEVSHGQVPDTLPSDKEFAGDNPRLSQVYEEAWLACRLIADKVGTAGLVRFYRLVGQDTDVPSAAVEHALRTVVGMSYADFVRQWRSELVTDLS
ncbi:MAG TPA: hypothetical protein VHC49_26925 [Mycobacteriales bacterium]|nr:hypothetical protein [Mycobacteriales bacterium]